MTLRKPVRKRAVKTPIPETAPDFRAYAHIMLDTMLNDFRGTDAIVFIVDGASGHEVASIPSSKAVKEGMFLAGYTKLFGANER